MAVLGAGIAGLTAAHELAERGFVVTVYEARRDERNGLGTEPPGTYPPVKLGGLAASQYSTVGTHDGSQAELRPFPGRRGQPRDPGRAAAGEHGFRFFPAYYLHIWDLFQRTPVYQLTQTADGTARWTATSRTVYDNVRRVVTKGTTVQGQPSLVFPSELPRSFAEFLGILSQFATLSFTPGDITTFQLRMLRYLATSPLRRARELQNMSAYDFLVGHDRTTGINQFFYTPPCDALLRHMPRILVALDSQWGDARTNLSTYLQLYLSMDRRDNKADGVLNGPTTESWLDHWYRHLVSLGVGFVHNKVTRLDPPAFHSSQPPHLRPRAGVTFADGTQVTPDYIVVAVDAPAAEYVTTALRAAGTGGTVARLDGYATIPPPPEGPLQPETTRPRQRRIPTRWIKWGGCRGIGSKRCAASSTTSTRNFSYSADICCSAAQSGRCRRSTRPDSGRSGQVWTATDTSPCCRSTSQISTLLQSSRRRVRPGQGGSRLHGRRNRRGGMATDRLRTHQLRRIRRGRGDAVARVVRARSKSDHG